MTASSSTIAACMTPTTGGMVAWIFSNSFSTRIAGRRRRRARRAPCTPRLAELIDRGLAPRGSPRRCGRPARDGGRRDRPAISRSRGRSRRSAPVMTCVPFASTRERLVAAPRLTPARGGRTTILPMCAAMLHQLEGFGDIAPPRTRCKAAACRCLRRTAASSPCRRARPSAPLADHQLVDVDAEIAQVLAERPQADMGVGRRSRACRARRSGRTDASRRSSAPSPRRPGC